MWLFCPKLTCIKSTGHWSTDGHGVGAYMQLSSCQTQVLDPGGWQVAVCDPMWHVSSWSIEGCCKLLYSIYLLTFSYSM